MEFPNIWHIEIFDQTFAGRSEAFFTGNVGQVYYNDVSSLYPTAIIKTQCMKIMDVEDVTVTSHKDQLLGNAHWTKFYEATGSPYGWVIGDFRVKDDLWGLPVKVGSNNWYVTGKFRNRLYHILDLQAANAEITHVDMVLTPIFDAEQNKLMKKFEELMKIKLLAEYENQIEKFCIKNTGNSTSGILGKSHPRFGSTTNIPAYNTLLAQSHLFMSELFHKFHTPQHPIVYTDTDSFFWHKPVGSMDRDELIRDCEPYPTLPFQLLETVPLKVGVRGTSRSDGCVIFRGKMYYQNRTPNAVYAAYSGWKPFPRYFTEIVETKPTSISVERQVRRKWRTRDRKATVLKVGRWFIEEECWDIKKLKRIFRADTKRRRPTYDSYQLFLDDEKAPSHARNAGDVRRAYSKQRGVVRYKRRIRTF